MKDRLQILIANHRLSVLTTTSANHPTGMLRSSPAKALSLHLLLSARSDPHSFLSRTRPRNLTGLPSIAGHIHSFISFCTHRSFPCLPFLYLLIIHLFPLVCHFWVLPICQFHQSSNRSGFTSSFRVFAYNA